MIGRRIDDGEMGNEVDKDKMTNQLWQALK